MTQTHSERLEDYVLQILPRDWRDKNVFTCPSHLLPRELKKRGPKVVMVSDRRETLPGGPERRRDPKPSEGGELQECGTEGPETVGDRPRRGDRHRKETTKDGTEEKREEEEFIPSSK